MTFPLSPTLVLGLALASSWRLTSCWFSPSLSPRVLTIRDRRSWRGAVRSTTARQQQRHVNIAATGDSENESDDPGWFVFDNPALTEPEPGPEPEPKSESETARTTAPTAAPPSTAAEANPVAAKTLPVAAAASRVPIPAPAHVPPSPPPLPSKPVVDASATTAAEENHGGSQGSSSVNDRRVGGGDGIGDEFWGSFYAVEDAKPASTPAAHPSKKIAKATAKVKAKSKPKSKPKTKAAANPAASATGPVVPSELVGQAPPAPSVVTGRIERVVFRGDSGYTVAALGSVVAEGMDAHLAELSSGKSGTVTIVSNGCLAAVNVGDFLTCAGGWVQDRKYGTQFRVTEAALAPLDEGIEGIRGWVTQAF